MRRTLFTLSLAALAIFSCSVPRPREPQPPPAISLEISKGIDQKITVPVGPPEAKLVSWVIEPPRGTPIRGTVLFLHGFLADHGQVQNAGEALRKSGYRAVLVDLRGFGESTGGNITFGHLDAGDLTQLTDYLQARVVREDRRRVRHVVWSGLGHSLCRR